MPKRQKVGSLSSVSVRELHAELRRRQRRVATLARRRSRLFAKLTRIEAAIRQHGGIALRGGSAGAPSGRARNDQSLPEMLHSLLSGKTMRVTDAAEAVQRAGYRTRSRTFRVQVNIVLSKRTDLFKRVGRGEYTSK